MATRVVGMAALPGKVGTEALRTLAVDKAVAVAIAIAGMEAMEMGEINTPLEQNNNTMIDSLFFCTLKLGISHAKLAERTICTLLITHAT